MSSLIEASVCFSDRHGKVVTIPSISIQYVIENVCLKRGEYHLPFSFIQETMSSFSFSLLPTKQWICTKFTHGKYVLKLWKLTGKDDKFYIYTPIYKEVVNRKERPLIIRMKVAHSDALKRLILLKCTAVNWCPDKNSNNKTNKKTITLFILPSLPRLLLVLHIS